MPTYFWHFSAPLVDTPWTVFMGVDGPLSEPGETVVEFIDPDSGDIVAWTQCKDYADMWRFLGTLRVPEDSTVYGVRVTCTQPIASMDGEVWEFWTSSIVPHWEPCTWYPDGYRVAREILHGAPINADGSRAMDRARDFPRYNA